MEQCQPHHHRDDAHMDFLPDILPERAPSVFLWLLGAPTGKSPFPCFLIADEPVFILQQVEPR